MKVALNYEDYLPVSKKENSNSDMVINSTNINKMNYHLSPTIIEEDIYGIEKSRFSFIMIEQVTFDDMMMISSLY
jgi:hypothetical protein